MSDLEDIPVIVLPNHPDKMWFEGYEVGEKLDRQFPEQDGGEFATACAYNGWGPVNEEVGITDLKMLNQGYNDGPEWVWYVRTSNAEGWIAAGGCDYTGWDCRSNLEWTKVAEWLT